MDQLPCNILTRIFLHIPPWERHNLRNVSRHWKSTVEQNVGLGVSIASQEGSEVDPESLINGNEYAKAPTDNKQFLPISFIETVGISDCVIGFLAENVNLPDFRIPHLLKTMSLEGKITSGNFSNSIRFEHLRVLKFSVQTLLGLSMSNTEITLPELQSLHISLQNRNNRDISEDSVNKLLVANVTKLLEGKGFKKLKNLHLHFFCFMSALDADVRNGVYKCLIHHKDSLKYVSIRLQFVDNYPDENTIISHQDVISRQTVQFSIENSPPPLTDFNLIFEMMPLDGVDYFGLQAKTWEGLVSHLNALHSYEQGCFDETWGDKCTFDDGLPSEYIPNKPPLPKELVLRNSESLRKLTLSIKSWDEENGLIEILDFEVFSTCLHLEELIIVGQWHEDTTGFIELNISCVENIDKLPKSLKILKCSLILIDLDDIQELINRNFQELHLKYFGSHGSYHIIRQEFLRVTSFISNFRHVSLLINTIDKSGKSLTKIDLIATNYMLREGDNKTTIIDAYVLKDCVSLKIFCLEGMEFERYFNRFEENSDSDKEDATILQDLIVPSGIHSIRYFPKSVEYIKLKNIFLKSNHLHFFVKELQNLRCLDLDGIGQFKTCGVTPQVIWEICLRKRIKRFHVTKGLNWSNWNGLNNNMGALGLIKTFPLLGTIMKLRKKRLCLELDSDAANYVATFD